MSVFKTPRIGVYQEKTRRLQKNLSYERTSLTWKEAIVYKYLGSRDSDNPSIKDIQVKAFSEVPDRAYSDEGVRINISVEMMSEQTTDLSRYGIIDPMGTEQTFRVHVKSYEDIGRPVVVGDVIEIPFFEQEGKAALWEIQDVDRTSEFENFYAVLNGTVLEDSRTTREVNITNSNSSVMDEIIADNDTAFDEQIPYNGVDTSEVDVDDPNTTTDDPYDPLNNNTVGDFWDDPSKTF